LIWTLGDDCPIYQAKRHYIDDETPTYWTLADLDGNHCGTQNGFRTCQAGISSSGFLSNGGRPTDGEVFSNGAATGIPDDCGDALFFAVNHPRQTIFTKTQWMWKEVPAPEMRQMRARELAVTKPAVTKAASCTATTTISATATTWTPTETPAPFTRQGNIHILRDGKKSGCLDGNGLWWELCLPAKIEGDANGFKMTGDGPCQWNPRSPKGSLICMNEDQNKPLTFTGEGNKIVNPVTNTTTWYAKAPPDPKAGEAAYLYGEEQNVAVEFEWIWVYHGHEYPLDETTARAARL